MVKLVAVQTNNELDKLAEIANIIWNEYFPSIIGQVQVDYMVEKFQSVSAFKKQIAEGYKYFWVIEEDERIGYVGLLSRPDIPSMQISKFYLLKNWRGKGFARQIVDDISTLASTTNLNRLYLTVNKYNKSTIDVYLKLGFKKKSDLVIDIGNGFIMDDYEMEKLIL
jgi:diamine N-acetyltransferase